MSIEQTCTFGSSISHSYGGILTTEKTGTDGPADSRELDIPAAGEVENTTATTATVPRNSNPASGRAKGWGYSLKAIIAAAGSAFVGISIKQSFGAGWANFVGAGCVALGSFLIAIGEDRKIKALGEYGLAFVTFGGVLIMTDAFPHA